MLIYMMTVYNKYGNLNRDPNDQMPSVAFERYSLQCCCFFFFAWICGNEIM